MTTNASMVNKNEVFELAIQNTFGSALTSLTASDHADVESGSILENSLNVHEVDETSGGFNQPQVVIGDMPAEVNLNYRLRSWGDDDIGSVGKAFQCAGFLVSNVSKVYTLTPTSSRCEWKDATVWHYTGSKCASGALLEKASNVMFDWEISLPMGGIPKVSFTGTGAHGGAATTATSPTITRNTQATKALTGVTMTILGVSYKVVEFAIQGGTTVENTIDQSATYGRGHTLITDKKIKWTAKVYATVVADGDPFAQMLAGTLATSSIAWGTGPNGWTIASGANKTQVTSRKKSDNNGVTTFDLEGVYIDNDMTIAIDTTP